MAGIDYGQMVRSLTMQPQPIAHDPFSTQKQKGVNAISPLEGAMPYRGGGTVRAYHGTTNPELRKFDPNHGTELGPHLGTAAHANRRIGGERAVENNPYAVPSIVPLNTRFKNSAEMKDPFSWEASGAQFQSALAKVPRVTSKEIEGLRGLSAKDARNYARNLLLSKGYDSIKYRNNYEGGTSDFSYIPLKRGTVKNAITGSTMFGLGGMSLGDILNGALDRREPEPPQ